MCRNYTVYNTHIQYKIQIWYGAGCRRGESGKGWRPKTDSIHYIIRTVLMG